VGSRASTSAPSVSAIVVAWNAAADLPSCIAALREAARSVRTGVSLEIIAIDNASSDGSAEAAADHGVDVVLENGVNAGYAVAASQGAALAKGEWLLFINADVRVEAMCLDHLLHVGHGLRIAESMAPELVYAADPVLSNSQGLLVDVVGLPAEIGNGTRAVSDAVPFEVFGATGACWMVSAKAFAEVGGFEPIYFAYLEDVDIAWRMQRSGIKTLCVPAARGAHVGSASTGDRSPTKAYLVARNRRILIGRHGPHSIRAGLWRMMAESGHCLASVLLSRSLAPLRGRRDAIALRRYVAFLREADSVSGLEPPTAVSLSPRVGLIRTWKRRSLSRTLMSIKPK
jgi:N-acetylglucosaminyl-diphospho-decaprenol L-rhamnosyltransferase